MTDPTINPFTGRPYRDRAGRCENCKNEFRKNRPWQKYCSDQCCRAFNSSRYIKKEHGIIICQGCGEQFTKRQPKHIFCTTKCYRAWYTKQKPKKQKVEEYNLKPLKHIEVDSNIRLIRGEILSKEAEALRCPHCGAPYEAQTKLSH